MRFDDAPARTWLFAALAGWAVLAWLLAVAGLGRRIAVLDQDPTLLQALPKPHASPPSRLGPPQQYGEIAQRPLFSNDRQPKPFVLNADSENEQQAKPFDYVLTSVLLGPRTGIAIVQPADGGEPVSFKLNGGADAAPSWQLVALEPRSATFRGPEGERVLELRQFDGNGGAPATPSAVARRPAGQQAAGPPPGPPPPPLPTAGVSGPATAARSPQAANPATPASPPDVNGRPQQQNQAQRDQNASAEAQIEAIRRRIQARREQLRREAQQQAPQSNTRKEPR